MPRDHGRLSGHVGGARDYDFILSRLLFHDDKSATGGKNEVRPHGGFSGNRVSQPIHTILPLYLVYLAITPWIFFVICAEIVSEIVGEIVAEIVGRLWQNYMGLRYKPGLETKEMRGLD